MAGKQFSAEDLSKITGLSKMCLDADSAGRLLSDMQHIMDLFEALDKVDGYDDPIDAVQSARTPTQCRQDAVSHTDISDKLPEFSDRFDTHSHYFKVPVVIDD